MPTNLLSCLITIASLTPPDCQLSDRYRFPNKEAAAAGLRLCREYRRQLDEAIPLDLFRREAWQEACRDAKRRYEAWDWLHDAQGGIGNGPTYWLHSLRKLREIIGEEAYQAGIMPFPLPYSECDP